MEVYYPAVFINNGDGFTVEFPDLPECVTEGDSLDEALEMAEDAAYGWIMSSIEEGGSIPELGKIENVDSENGFVYYICLDLRGVC